MEDNSRDARSLKRRRVTRACDECRRKKIKCSGTNPCVHCTVYSYSCTFDQPSNRRRNPPTGYLEKLESRCERYEELIQRFLPHIELDVEVEETGRDQADDSPDSDTKVGEGSGPSLESMLDHSLGFSKDPEGNVDFKGQSSGTVFVKSLCGQLGVGGGSGESRDIYGPGPVVSYDHTPGVDRDGIKVSPDRTRRPSSNAHSRGQLKSPDGSLEELDEIQLPPYEVARQLTRLCFDNACAIIQFVHEPSFYARLDAYYADEEGSPTDESFLSVLYASMAVGCLFLGVIKGQLDIEDPKVRAFQYFQASKSLVDPLDRANTEILQTLLCQVLFLQSTANMSTCYSYLGTALRCALRMGVHRKFDQGFSPIELQLRSKMFWSIRNIEVFLCAILGLPRGISGEDFDQSLPVEVDDEYITADGVGRQPEGVISNAVSFNAYSRLMTIMYDIVRLCYGLSTSYRSPQRIVSIETVDVLASRLDQWSQDLHPLLQPTTLAKDAGLEIFRQSRLLRYMFYHAYVLLHRPYLHYLTSTDESTKKYRTCGKRTRVAALGILRLTEEIFVNEPTCFGHWFSIYATFFGGMILLYCVVQERPVSEDRAQCLRYIEIAKQAMDLCSRCNFAAERCHQLMDDLAKQVPTHDTIRDSASKVFDTLHQRGLGEANAPKDTNGTLSDSNSRVPSGEVSWSTTPDPRRRRPSANSVGHKEYPVDGPYSAPPDGQFPDTPGLPRTVDRSRRVRDPFGSIDGVVPTGYDLGLMAGHNMNGFQPYQIFPTSQQTQSYIKDTYQPNNPGSSAFQEFLTFLQHDPNHSQLPESYAMYDSGGEQPFQNMNPTTEYANQWTGYGADGIGPVHPDHQGQNYVSAAAAAPGDYDYADFAGNQYANSLMYQQPRC